MRGFDLSLLNRPIRIRHSITACRETFWNAGMGCSFDSKLVWLS